MQFRYGLFLLAAAALSQLAHGQPPVEAPALGAAQGVLDFCSKIDPADGRVFDRQSRLLLQGRSEKSIDELQKSTAYRNGHETLLSVLGELSADDARAACHAISPAPIESYLK
jgi:hypothetical protein